MRYNCKLLVDNAFARNGHVIMVFRFLLGRVCSMSSAITYDQHPPDRDYGPTVLIVDDETLSRTRLKILCSPLNHDSKFRVLEAVNLTEAMSVIASNTVHVVLLDKNLDCKVTGSSENGIAAIPQMISLNPNIQILMVTGSDTVSDVVDAMKCGAFGYVPKNAVDEIVVAQIKKALAMATLTVEKTRQERISRNGGAVDLAGNSPAIQALRARIEAVAESSKEVLLLGESGTGKTTAARLIHEYRKQYLKQRDRPFFAINMGAISADLAERELFGNERGAYTDAKDAMPGYFEMANNGTLFMDEIGEAPLALQTKLLRVIEEKKFFRLGGTHERQTSFKLICATNRNLEEMVEQGLFRRDLYYRLTTFPIQIPSLAERKEDIPAIIESLIPKCCEENRVYITFKDLPSDFVEYLTNTPTKGNVRGIEQQISRLLIYSPKDKRGRPIFDHWQNISGLQHKRSYTVGPKGAITWQELASRPTNLLGPDFPGLPNFIEQMTRRILLEAKGKFTTQSEMAAALKVSAPRISVLLKGLAMSKKLVGKQPATAERQAPAADAVQELS